MNERHADLTEVFRVADGRLNLISFPELAVKRPMNFKQSCFQTSKFAGGFSAYFQCSCPITAF